MPCQKTAVAQVLFALDIPAAQRRWGCSFEAVDTGGLVVAAN